MKKMKGQGALEYLMTYGWAILIIVIIGGALYALGVFNPSTWTSSKRATGFASLQVKDWKVAASDGQLTVVMGNKYGSALTLTGVNATRPGTTYGCNNTQPALTTVLSENQEVSLTTVNTSPPFSGTCAGGLTSGKSYTIDVQIFFTANGVSHIDSGTLTGKVE